MTIQDLIAAALAQGQGMPPPEFGNVPQQPPPPGFMPMGEPVPEMAPQLPGGTNDPRGVMDRFALGLAANPIGPPVIGPRSPHRNRDLIWGNLISSATNAFANDRMRQMGQTDALNKSLQAQAAARNAQNIALSNEARAAATEYGKGLASHRWRLEEIKASKGQDEAQMGPTPKELVALGYPSRMRPSDADTAMRMRFPDRFKSQFMAGGFDPSNVLGEIDAGRAPATSSGYSRGQWGAIVSANHGYKGADGKPVNLTNLGLQYAAINQRVKSLNQGQMLQYQAAIMKAAPTLDYTEGLIDQLQSLVPTGRIPELNRATLAAISRGAFGPQASDLATQIIGQISGPLEGEMSTVYSRGGVPTDEGRVSVRRQVNENLGYDRLKAAFKAMRRDLGYADLSVREVAANPPLFPGTPMPGAQGGGSGKVETWAKDPKTGKYVLSGSK